ncbi:hypothetical protein R3I93_001263 [Phoxinus phoxinus]|uniref:C-type lectin domain-containing protein n=1 Tax=Phoxinus phoxinus TaxID=58324 RepID=A0AAN9DN63_9TELE
MSWSDAQAFCRQKHTDLAIADDQTDLAELRKITSEFQEDTWIGLYMEPGTSSWIWSDLSNSGFNSGGIQFCVYTSPDGSWSGWECLEKKAFICYATEMKRQIVRLEVKSSQNLNDPEVKKEILMKIEQILKEKGLPEEAKLSWKLVSGEKVFQRMISEE